MSCGCGYNMDGRRDDDFLSDLLGNNENTEINIRYYKLFFYY